MDLTPREREVAALIIDGKADAEIAETLVISRLTVAAHRANIRAKLMRKPGNDPSPETSSG